MLRYFLLNTFAEFVRCRDFK